MADNWFSDLVEYILPGEDDKGLIKNIFGSDDDTEITYDYPEAGTYTSGTPAKGGSAESKAIMDLLFGLSEGEEATYDYPDVGTTTTGKTYTDYQDILDILESFGPQDLGGGASATYGYDDPKSDYDVIWGNEGLLGGGTTDSGLPGGAPSGGGGTPKAIKAIEDIIKTLWGGAEAGASGIASGIGGLMESKLGQLALLNYMRNKDKAARDIPMGQQAFGSSEVYGNVGAPDYRVFNIQPALMPGVAYANVAQPETPPPTPPPMRHGGIAGLASREGPGDITLAKLEPGEFVVTKKATDNIGAQNLYRMMKQAEGMS